MLPGNQSAAQKLLRCKGVMHVLGSVGCGIMSRCEERAEKERGSGGGVGSFDEGGVGSRVGR